MKNATVFLGPEVDAAILALIDYVEVDEIPAVLNFLDRIQERLVNTLSTFPEGGSRFQGNVRMKVVEKYAFLYEYHADTNEVHVLDMKGPGLDWR
jgi:hypothetical protein